VALGILAANAVRGGPTRTVPEPLAGAERELEIAASDGRAATPEPSAQPA